MTDKEKKTYYVTKLEEMESNHFKVKFATYASCIVGIVLSSWQLYEMIIKNSPANMPIVGATSSVALIAGCLWVKHKLMQDDKAEMREKIDNINEKSR